MREYLDIDEDIKFVDTRGREITTTFRELAYQNGAEYYYHIAEKPDHEYRRSCRNEED